MPRVIEIKERIRIATIGGTFDALHRGHQEYIKLAFDISDYTIIYLSTNEYLHNRKTKNYQVKPYEERYEQLENFVKQLGCEKRCEIRPHSKEDDFIVAYLNEFTRHDTLYMAIVSPEYYEKFLEINRQRENHSLNSILLFVKPRFRDGNNELTSGFIRSSLKQESALELSRLSSNE
jgi:cytidyltransferase-like protein